jgi:hypothetical protein
MTSQIVCNSCNTPNPAGSQTCMLCQQPLMMTMLSQIAPAVQRLPTLLPMSSAGASLPGVTGPQALVPIDQLGNEDFARALTLPAGTFSHMVGWTDFDQGHFPQLDLAKLFPDHLVTDTNGQKLVNISRKSATLRRDTEGNLFISADIDSASLMWVSEPGTAPFRVLPGDEAFLLPGMYVFLGKNQAGITFVVR